MKFTAFIFILFLVLSSCKAQNDPTLESLIITEFVKNIKGNTGLLKDNKLYVLGYGYNFSVDDIQVLYISLDKVKEKVRKEGEFNMVSIKEIYPKYNMLKTSFTFLTAKQNDEADFTTQDNFNEIYCVKYNCDTEGFSVFWCGDE